MNRGCSNAAADKGPAGIAVVLLVDTVAFNETKHGSVGALDIL
jgi:hypothetical protein